MNAIDMRLTGNQDGECILNEGEHFKNKKKSNRMMKNMKTVSMQGNLGDLANENSNDTNDDGE